MPAHIVFMDHRLADAAQASGMQQIKTVLRGHVNFDPGCALIGCQEGFQIPDVPFGKGRKIGCGNLFRPPQIKVSQFPDGRNKCLWSWSRQIALRWPVAHGQVRWDRCIIATAETFGL